MLGHQVSSPIDQVGPNLITMLMGMGLKRDSLKNTIGLI